MAKPLLHYFIRLTEFLGDVLGPDYEVALHDASAADYPIIAIANGHVTGRTLGAPLPDSAMRTVMSGKYLEEDYRANYNGLAKSQKLLRCSALFLPDEENSLLGVLCIHFDDSRFQDLSDHILKLCHPDQFVNHFVCNPSARYQESVSAGTDSESVPRIIEDIIGRALGEKDVPADRLSKEEKVEIVRILHEKGIFMTRGAVDQVAERLHSSRPSIYRYLGMLK